MNNYNLDDSASESLHKFQVNGLAAVRMGMLMRLDAYPYTEEQKKDLRSKIKRRVKLAQGSWMDDIFARVCSELMIDSLTFDAMRAYFFKPFEGPTIQIANED